MSVKGLKRYLKHFAGRLLHVLLDSFMNTEIKPETETETVTRKLS